MAAPRPLEYHQFSYFACKTGSPECTKSDHFCSKIKKYWEGTQPYLQTPPHWEAGHVTPPPQTSHPRRSAPILAALNGNVFAVFASLYEHNQPASCVLITTSAAKHLDALAGTRGTDSWLDGTVIGNNFGPDLRLRISCIYLKCTKFGQLILRRIIKIVATRF